MKTAPSHSVLYVAHQQMAQLVLFSLILHLNKEPYWITCFSFIPSKGVLP